MVVVVALANALASQTSAPMAAEVEYEAARRYAGLTGQVIDRERALAHLRRAAELGLLAAQRDLAFTLLNGNDRSPGDAKASLHWFRAAAKGGSVTAQCMLGDFYRRGLGGVRRNEAEAFRWYSSSAIQSDACAPRAQFELFRSYDGGLGTRRDPALAIRWLKQSAHSGYPQAQATLAQKHATGLGVAQDMRLAKLWLRRSREGVAPHEDHDHEPVACPPWVRGQLQQLARCIAG